MTGSSGPSFSVSVELLLFGAGAVLTLVAAGIFFLVLLRRDERSADRSRDRDANDPPHD
ncbi:MAG: hypothetical protein KDA22_06475 [Phycisphaerales bacterium]|nr:hypothetical protein [Phycisphaerales bacterium]